MASDGTNSWAMDETYEIVSEILNTVCNCTYVDDANITILRSRSLGQQRDQSFSEDVWWYVAKGEMFSLA
jgi:hypothetical protein